MQSIRQKPPVWVVGIDEVGRGPLAGPIHVCVVAMRYDRYKKMRWRGYTHCINDSKKMTEIARAYWMGIAKEWKKQELVSFAVASQTAQGIDRRGISQSIKTCIKTGLQKLEISPENTLVLLDGSLHAPKEYAYQKTIIKGDQKEKIISLASVIAKVTRDAYMTKQAKKYAVYGWESNKGYGTASHRRAIRKHGLTSLHRKSYLTRILDNMN